jgi:hypothetical protein
VLENFDDGSVQRRDFSDVLMTKLLKILNTPVQHLPHNWVDEVSDIVDEMSLEEFALQGRELIEFLLKVNDPSCEALTESALLQQAMASREPVIHQTVRHQFPAWLSTAAFSSYC